MFNNHDAIKGLIPGSEFEFCVSLKEDIVKMIDHFFDIRRSTLTRITLDCHVLRLFCLDKRLFSLHTYLNEKVVLINA